MTATSTPEPDAATNKTITAISWTGGKDCNLALLYAKRDPTLDVRYLLCFRLEDKAFRAHPIPFMEEQADAIGLPLLFVDIPKDTDDYMKAYVEGVRKVKDAHRITAIVTGDMDLVGTMERNWMEQVCETLDMKCHLPLWKMDRVQCLETLLKEGFDIIFTCVKAPFFDGSWINRSLDENALKEMQDIVNRKLETNDEGGEGEEKVEKKLPLDLAGERGEYHTMCVNGPFYNKRVVMDVNAEPHREDIRGGTHWKGNIHNADSIWTISLKIVG
mmetsp:Transcript_3937/g.8685  ORF Transcript_3937/g.8685 Transcript_3937/m.8685 type:complete len:273 (+) Transcript_3937:156-974(+)|eukprot:CAMPEP_0183712608 /NCGR_PEP_ID=MMETSP0737-20130205/7700_1 /TAXON_ID=385413 /ORGANISM="Thalassiosira miniscula, Strain CCMP1093" /LENGTH=272 /DNA_ID=CAMNT_0025941259 /DNA_START=86 /DNA_END=904 /DNA_ORIENTATION=+